PRPNPASLDAGWRGPHEAQGAHRYSHIGIYGISTADRPQSALMLRARITLPHFSVSSAMCLPKSAGEPGSTVPPRSASRGFMLGPATPALISLLSLSTISTGVFLGALPGARLVTRYEFGNGRDVRQRIQAPLDGHRQRAQFAGSHVLEQRCRGAEV